MITFYKVYISKLTAKYLVYFSPAKYGIFSFYLLLISFQDKYIKFARGYLIESF